MTELKKPELDISLHGGRDMARVVTELEPGDFGKAEIVTHLRNQTQRAADRLFHAGTINASQHLAASYVREDFEHGWRGRLRAGGWEARVDQATNVDPLLVAAAYELYLEAMTQLSRDERRLVRDVIVLETMSLGQ